MEYGLAENIKEKGLGRASSFIYSVYFFYSDLTSVSAYFFTGFSFYFFRLLTSVLFSFLNYLSNFSYLHSSKQKTKNKNLYLDNNNKTNILIGDRQ